MEVIVVDDNSDPANGTPGQMPVFTDLSPCGTLKCLN